MKKMTGKVTGELKSIRRGGSFISLLFCRWFTPSVLSFTRPSNGEASLSQLQTGTGSLPAASQAARAPKPRCFQLSAWAQFTKPPSPSQRHQTGPLAAGKEPGNNNAKRLC